MLFELGVLPAIDPGKSVSRVGGKAQRAVYRAVTGDLKLDYAQFGELEAFARFGARVDENTRGIIEHGRRIRACLQQPESAPVSVPEQIILLLALIAKLFDEVPLDRMGDAEQAVKGAVTDIPAELLARMETADNLSDEERQALLRHARHALSGLGFSQAQTEEQTQGPAPILAAGAKPEPES
jgi:F-type H+-transporting ATPase subunit alpha